MHTGKHGPVGCAAIIAGVVIILALILPTDFWWFVLAAVLIFAGLWYIRRC